MPREVLRSVQINSTPLFVPGGEVREWTRKVNAQVKSAVKAKAPPRRTYRKWPRKQTGNLNRSIRSEMTPPSRRRASGRVSVNVGYARFVLGGTAYQGLRYIYSKEGANHKAEIATIMRRVPSHRRAPTDWFMRLPPGPGAIRQLRVHGQKSNPFLTDGYNEVARLHQALRPMRSAFRFTR